MDLRRLDQIHQDLNRLGTRQRDPAMDRTASSSPTQRQKDAYNRNIQTRALAQHTAAAAARRRLNAAIQNLRNNTKTATTPAASNIVRKTQSGRSGTRKMTAAPYADRTRSTSSPAADMQRIDAVLGARSDAECGSRHNSHLGRQEENADGDTAQPWQGETLDSANDGIKDLEAIMDHVEQQHQATDAVAHRVTADMKKNLEGLFLMFQHQQDYICDMMDTPDPSAAPTPMPEIPEGKNSPSSPWSP